jgi:hypothetical protein
VWDSRRPNTLLHKFSHGEPSTPEDPDKIRDRWDTGIRFLSFNKHQLYSGSSDGVLKVWDIRRAAEDIHRKDVATFDSGIMAGAFSPDTSKLLIGELNGSINVLEVDRTGQSPREAEDLRMTSHHRWTQPGMDSSARRCAQEMIDSGEIVIRPFGGLPTRQAVQGPCYDIFDQASDANSLRAEAKAFQQKHAALEKFDSCDIYGCGLVNPVEEEGDHNIEPRWQYRTVEGFRRLRDGPRFKPVMGRKLCANKICGRLVHELASESSTLCEICDFACFRCGESCAVLADAMYVRCSICMLAWRGEALGWRLVEDDTKRPRISSTKQKPHFRILESETADLRRLREEEKCTLLGAFVAEMDANSD